jgi:hypothetical protein
MEQPVALNSEHRDIPSKFYILQYKKQKNIVCVVEAHSEKEAMSRADDTMSDVQAPITDSGKLTAKQILSVSCPQCGAEICEHCVGFGRKPGEAHIQRRLLALGTIERNNSC